MQKYLLVDKFAGFRRKEDITNMSPGIMVEGSQNVLTNDGERVAVRKGYTLDGQANPATTPIRSSYDWYRHAGDERNVRSYFDELQYRYVDADAVVTWRTLADGWGDEVDFNYAEQWDTSELIDQLCMVNGSSNIYTWSGGIALLDAATSSTIRISGATSIGELGFYSAGNLVMDGVDYTYTSFVADTFYGVTPDPLASVIDQSQTTQDAVVAFGESDATTKFNKIAQSFTASASTISGVQLYKAANTGSFSGAVTVEIFLDFAGEPVGAALASATIFSGTWLLKPDGMFGVTWTPIALTPAQDYWIVISASTASDTSHPNLGTNSAGGYASGSVSRFNTTDNWVAVPTIDLFFRTITSQTEPSSGEIIHQGLTTIPNSSITGLPDTFHNDLIGVLYNQLYVGSFVDRSVYISKQNSVTDFTFSSPRTVGEGAVITLDATPVGFVPQEDAMYIAAGKSFWYQTVFTLSSDLVNESLNVTRLKTGVQQAAQSQALITSDKNDVVFVTNEPTIVPLGRIELVEKPQIKNLSDPIKLDMDEYDFTGGAIKYFQDNTYVAVPRNGVVRIWNISKGWWEAPQILPISRFAIIDGELYGHSSVTAETYKLFNGTSDNDAPIAARANFSYQQFGDRANLKTMTEMYSEGYISPNTTLTQTIVYDYHGKTGTTNQIISGSDSDILFDSSSDGSLGKQSLGKKSLAGRSDTISSLLPPKWRVSKEFSNADKDFYECQVQFSSDGVDQSWELLAFGPNAEMSKSEGANIKQA